MISVIGLFYSRWQDTNLLGLIDMSDLKATCEHIRRLPWPVLAKSTRDFGLYDSLLMGYADRALHGEHFDSSDIPIPDAETIEFVNGLRTQHRLLADEKAFLEYFDLLEQVRLALTGK